MKCLSDVPQNSLLSTNYSTADDTYEGDCLVQYAIIRIIGRSSDLFFVFSIEQKLIADIEYNNTT